MRAGKALEDDHFVHMPERQKSTLFEVERIKPWRHRARQRKRRRTHRQGLSGHIKKGTASDTPFDSGNAFNPGNPVDDQRWRTGGWGENVGQPVALVILKPRFTQGLQHPRHHHEEAYADGNNKGDGPGLSTNTPEIAHELMIERTHSPTIRFHQGLAGFRSRRPRGWRHRRNGSRDAPWPLLRRHGSRSRRLPPTAHSRR